MGKKLVFIDFDGTLVQGKKVSQYTKNVIKNFQEKGNKVIMCTGRPRYAMEQLQEEMELNSYLITSNGSDIYDWKNKKVVYESFIDKETINKMLDYLYSNNLEFLMLSQNTEYTNSKRFENLEQLPETLEEAKEVLENEKIKQMVLTANEDIDLINEKKKYFLNLDNIDILNDGTKRNKSWASFGNKGESKGKAIKYLVEYLNADPNDTIGIGNDYNDISMLKQTALSVATQSAIDEVKTLVDEIIPNPDEEGVAKFLESLDI